MGKGKLEKTTSEMELELLDSLNNRCLHCALNAFIVAWLSKHNPGPGDTVTSADIEAVVMSLSRVTGEWLGSEDDDQRRIMLGMQGSGAAGLAQLNMIGHRDQMRKKLADGEAGGEGALASIKPGALKH